MAVNITTWYANGSGVFTNGSNSTKIYPYPKHNLLVLLAKLGLKSALKHVYI